MDLVPLKEPLAASSFRALLQSELARRCAANKHYSLRSFAQHLGLDHSTLSQLLRGRRPLTEDMIRRLGGELKLQPAEIEVYVAYERWDRTSDSGPDREMVQLVHDVAALLSEPCHRQILELAASDSFQANTRWIARVLDSDPDDVNRAITRLIRLRILEMTDQHQWTAAINVDAADAQSFARLAVERLAEPVRRLRNDHK